MVESAGSLRAAWPASSGSACSPWSRAGYVVADWQSVLPKDWTAAEEAALARAEGRVTEHRFDLPESHVETIAERAAALVLERVDARTAAGDSLACRK